jgi:predicted sulfurtransferase
MQTKTLLLLLLLSFLTPSHQALAATDPQAQAWTQVLDEARRGNYKLIMPEDIRGRFLENPDSLLLIDTRQEWEYHREHIKGAVNLPVTPTWRTQYSPWARAEMKKLLGPDKKRLAIFY